MKELSDFAKDVVRAGRGATNPTATDEERVLGALRESLGGSSSVEVSRPTGEPTPAPGTAGNSIGSKLVAALIGGGLITGALVFALRDAAPEARVSAPAPIATAGTVAQLPTEGPSPAPSTEAPAPTPAPPPETAKAPADVHRPSSSASGSSPSDEARAEGGLAREVLLLSKATSALSAGRAAEALQVLAEHQREFPRGVLAQERRAARAQALCRLGRKSEALAELGHLSQSSPQAARVRQACGLDGSTTTR